MDKYSVLYDDTVQDPDKAYHVIQKMDYNYGMDIVYHFYVRNVSRSIADDIATAMNVKEKDA